jgi:small subunit ribosomal protein S11
MMNLVPGYIVHIKSSLNNTIITITDLNGNTLAWASAGSVGFKGTRRSTSFAAQTAAEHAVMAFRRRPEGPLSRGGEQTFVAQLSGLGPGREAAIKGLQMSGLSIVLVVDKTSTPHNGCRPPKPRRL